jgi:hypothetical protein
MVDLSMVMVMLVYQRVSGSCLVMVWWCPLVELDGSSRRDNGYGCQGAVVMITGVASCVSVLDLARHAAESIPNARTSSLLVRLTCTDANMHTSYNKYVHRIYSIHKSYPYYIFYISLNIKYIYISLYIISIWYNTHIYISYDITHTHVCIYIYMCVC